MDNKIACIEIGSDSLRLLIGYELNGEPICLYKKEIPVPGLLKDGMVSDPLLLESGLKNFSHIIDEDAHIQISIQEVSLCLPSVGFLVYQNDKTTNVVSQTNEIAKIDISNVVSLVRKETVGGGNAIVDIIPDEFVLDNGERYANPPLGKKSSTLTIKAKVHCLPESTFDTIRSVASKAGFRIKKVVVGAFCETELFRVYPDLPTNYLLLDIGSRLSTLTFVGNSSPYGSSSFFRGGSDLTLAIAKAFGISENSAEDAKRRFGYDTRTSSYVPPILQGIGPDGAKTNYYQKDLNMVIKSFFDGYTPLAQNATKAILDRYNGRFDSIPVLVTGGSSRLYGLESFLKLAFPGREIRFVSPRTIGALQPSYTPLLGAVLACSKYVGSLEDNYHGMASVSRAPAKEKKGGKRTTSPSEDTL